MVTTQKPSHRLNLALPYDLYVAMTLAVKKGRAASITELIKQAVKKEIGYSE